jgi:hypothetical protein
MILEPKHIIPYLPYGLKIDVSYYDIDYSDYEIEGKIDYPVVSGINIREENVFCYYGLNNYGKIEQEYALEHIKPILHPLSDLTQEIEVNGERFVPIERLFELEYPANKGGKHNPYYYDKQTNYTICSHDGTIYDLRVYTNIEFILKQKYWIVQKLAEWHIDFQGLIPAGLAIDIDINLNKKL